MRVGGAFLSDLASGLATNDPGDRRANQDFRQPPAPPARYPLWLLLLLVIVIALLMIASPTSPAVKQQQRLEAMLVLPVDHDALPPTCA